MERRSSMVIECVWCVTRNIGRNIKGGSKLKERIAREEIQLNLKKILQREICAKVLSPFVKMKFISQQIVLYQTL